MAKEKAKTTYHQIKTWFDVRMMRTDVIFALCRG